MTTIHSSLLQYIKASFVEPDDPALVFCNLCKLRPVQESSFSTSCGHYLCKHCLPSFVDQCPVCSHPVTLLTVAPFIVRVVETRKVKCPFNGCDWKGVYGHAGSEIRHHHAECGFLQWECTDCKEMLTRSVQGTHVQVCPNRKVKCQHKCGGEFPLAELEAHAAACPHAIVDCAFVRFGCSAILKRRDIVEHDVAAMDQHFRYLLGKIDSLEEKNKQFEKRLDQLAAPAPAASAPFPFAKRPRGRPRKVAPFPGSFSSWEPKPEPQPEPESNHDLKSEPKPKLDRPRRTRHPPALHDGDDLPRHKVPRLSD